MEAMSTKLMERRSMEYLLGDRTSACLHSCTGRTALRLPAANSRISPWIKRSSHFGCKGTVRTVYSIFMVSTRESVLLAAIDLIIREGVDSLTLDRVAREAGVSKGGLLYHYAGKEQLIAGLVGLLMAG